MKMKNRELISEKEYSDLTSEIELVIKLINGNICKMPKK